MRDLSALPASPSDPAPPVLSVVVAIVSDTAGQPCSTEHLVGSLEALARQVDPPPMEIIVPYHHRVADIDRVKIRFPKVVFLPVNHLNLSRRGRTREHHDELKARGLAAARGEIAALMEDHDWPHVHWCASLVEAHRQAVAAVGGAIENGVDRLVNWAVYFCDFGRYQNPLPLGESTSISDVNASYKRAALEAIRPIWQGRFQEPVVNQALRARGDKLLLSPSVIVYQHRNGLRLAGALRERVTWGRSYAAGRGTRAGTGKRLLYAALSPLLPLLLVSRIASTVIQKGRCRGKFLQALPLIILLTLGWSWGEFLGYLTGRPR